MKTELIQGDAVTELKKIDFLGQILNLLHKFNPAECLLPINLFEDKELKIVEIMI